LKSRLNRTLRCKSTRELHDAPTFNAASGLTWIFDLDNTLHNASHAFFPAINANMNAYMARLLGINDQLADADTVNAARLAYWKKYGATLLGLVRHHQVNQAEFLREAHQFDDFSSMLRFESGLKRLFSRLPGRKILLTNAPRHYSRQVLRQLGLHRYFFRHISIESMRVHGHLRPKPARCLYRKILAQQKLTAQRCVLIEDTRDNLRTAKQTGIKTVWVTQYLKDNSMRTRGSFIDVKVRSIKQLPENLSRLSR